MAELERLIRDTDKPLPPIVPGHTTRGTSRSDELRRWAHSVVEVYDRAREAGFSDDEIEANQAVSLAMYRDALEVLESGRLPQDDEEIRPLDED